MGVKSFKERVCHCVCVGRVGRGGSRVKTLPPARHFPLQLPPDSPDSFVAFPCELEPQIGAKCRAGEGERKERGKKKRKKKRALRLFCNTHAASCHNDKKSVKANLHMCRMDVRQALI